MTQLTKAEEEYYRKPLRDDHMELLNAIQSVNNRLDVMDKKINPMYDLFDSVSGWNRISIWILKGLILVGASIGVVYGFIKYLKE